MVTWTKAPNHLLAIYLNWCKALGVGGPARNEEGGRHLGGERIIHVCMFAHSEPVHSD